MSTMRTKKLHVVDNREPIRAFWSDISSCFASSLNTGDNTSYDGCDTNEPDELESLRQEPMS